MYHPTPEQAEADRKAAYEAGVPHGYVAPGDRHRGGPTITLRVVSDLVRGLAAGLAEWRAVGRLQRAVQRRRCSSRQCACVRWHPSHRWVGSTQQAHASASLPRQHTDDEYGEEVGPDGQHRGGPFSITVSPKMRVEELRKVIRVSRAILCCTAVMTLRQHVPALPDACLKGCRSCVERVQTATH